jgi:hypothetical protein
MNRYRMSKIMVLLMGALLVGCESMPLMDPHSVGKGRYLQFFDQGGRVIAETDTHMAGLMSCPNQAYLAIQKNPSISGLLRCSEQSLSGVLPFYFLAHRQHSESDGYLRSSPYMVRAMTSQLCASLRQETSKMEKTVILENNCKESKDALNLPDQVEKKTTDSEAKPESLSTVERLRQLDQLRREKLISDAEFKTRRKAILDRL